MEHKGKAVENYSNNNFSDFNYSSASEMSCQKHPNTSSVGICPQCLKDRLLKLVCSDCGEQRLSSCSCSDICSSDRNSCSTIGSVGRISFLLENDKMDKSQLMKWSSKSKKNDSVIYLRRSSSSCVEVKKRNGFWRIKRLFRKKLSRGLEKNGEISDDRSEIWVSDIMGVSRSRSLCSFRGGEGSDWAYSSAKISDVTSGIFSEFEHRKSGFRGLFDSENGIDFKGSKKDSGQFDRSCSVQNKNVFPVKESDFSSMDESAFIDLKLDFTSETKKEVSAARISGASDHGLFLKSESFGSLKNNGMFGYGGDSCRISVDKGGLKRGSRSHKVWKWIFKYHRASKKEESDLGL